MCALFRAARIDPDRRWSARSLDWWLAIGVFGTTVAYIVHLPRSLGLADESFFLYEAKRIRDGEVMYRDFFQFVTPIAPYVMAGLYWLFGTSMTTARAAMAVVHGLAALLLYVTARQLGCRRVFAVSVPLVYVGACQPVWPVASWHWFSTCFILLLLCLLVAEPPASRRWWSLAEGLAAGVLTGTQQQKGALIVAGTCAVFAVHAIVEQRYGAVAPWRRAATRLAWFAMGIALIMVPLLVTFVAIAGFGPVYDALVRFPLENYRPNLRIRWGSAALNLSKITALSSPLLLRYVPLAMVPPLLLCLAAFLRRRDRDTVLRLMSLILVAGSSTLSIWYFPSLVHIAFIAAPLVICAAVGIEWLAGLSGALVGRIGDAVAWVAGAAVIAALVVHLGANATFLRQRFSIPYESAFGRVDFAAHWQAAIVDAARARLDQSASPALFCYGHLTGLYLLTGARNPVPYQYLDAKVSPRRHVRETLEILERQDIRYAIRRIVFMNPNDPIVAFLKANYRQLPIRSGELDGFPGFLLYERIGRQPDA